MRSYYKLLSVLLVISCTAFTSVFAQGEDQDYPDEDSYGYLIRKERDKKEDKGHVYSEEELYIRRRKKADDNAYQGSAIIIGDPFSSLKSDGSRPSAADAEKAFNENNPDLNNPVGDGTDPNQNPAVVSGSNLTDPNDPGGAGVPPPPDPPDLPINKGLVYLCISAVFLGVFKLRSRNTSTV